MARRDGTSFDVAALNGRGGNLITGNRGGKDLIGSDRGGSNLLRCDRPGNNDRAVDLLLVFLILELLYRKPGCFSIDLVDDPVSPGDDQALRCQCAGSDNVSVQGDNLGSGNGSVRDLGSSDSALGNQRGCDRA